MTVAHDQVRRALLRHWAGGGLTRAAGYVLIFYGAREVRKIFFVPA